MGERFGHFVDSATTTAENWFARDLPQNPALPKTGKDLTDWIDVSHPDAADAGHRTYDHPTSGDRIRVDKAKPGAPGWEGVDHFHWENPDSTGKKDKYLDKNGNPTPKGSDPSHQPFDPVSAE